MADRIVIVHDELDGLHDLDRPDFSRRNVLSWMVILIRCCWIGWDWDDASPALAANAATRIVIKLIRIRLLCRWLAMLHLPCLRQLKGISYCTTLEPQKPLL
jgi:hypothetical protein